MDFDQLLVRFFGTDDIAALPPEQIVAGVERLRLQFGLERDGGRRFGLWCLMYMLGTAPDLDVASRKRRTGRPLASSWTWPIGKWTAGKRPIPVTSSSKRNPEIAVHSAIAALPANRQNAGGA